MLMDRIIGAFTFRRRVYAEVEKDTGFTTTAWILVVVIAFLSQLGGLVSGNLIGWVIASVELTIFAVIGFAAACFVIQLVGRVLFNAEVTFAEMVRTLGLAYVWNVVAVLGVMRAVPALECLVAPVRFGAWILGLLAWLVAAKEALDLGWVPTVVIVIIGWIVLVVITMGGLVALSLGFPCALAGVILPG